LVEDGAVVRVRWIEYKLALLSPWSGTAIPRQRTAACFNNGDDCDQQLPTPLSFRRFIFPPSVTGLSAFPVAAARVWNSLPVSITSAATLSTFKQRLKTELFICCYDLHHLLSFSYT